MTEMILSRKWRLGLPAFLFLGLAAMTFYEPLPDPLAIAITADLVVTVPLLYWLLIYPTQIPKTTVIPVLFIGVLIGTFTLPQEQQYYLTLVKTWVLPVLELLVLGTILYKVHQARKWYQANPQRDFYMRLLRVTQNLFPAKISFFMAAELSIPYYCWAILQKHPLAAHEFSYHKKSGSIALLWVLMLILMVETIALHFLLLLWSPIAAWIATLLSLYTCLQIGSLMGSMKKRPIVVQGQNLWLKYGTLGNAQVSLDKIKNVCDYSLNLDMKDAIRWSPLGEMERPNVCLEFKEPIEITMIFGQQKQCKQLVLFVDKKEAFKAALKGKGME